MNQDLLEEVLGFGSSIFASGAVLSICYMLLVLIVAKSFNKYINRIITNIAVAKKRDGDMLFILLRKLIKGVIYTIALVLILYEFLPLRNFGTAIIGVSGIATVAITLGAQELASNFVSGIVISAYEPFKKGDLIYLNEKNIVGVIEDLNFRHCVIRTFENSKIIVPNKVLNEAIVENRGSVDSDPYFNLYNYGIAYDSDYQLAMKIIGDYLKTSDLVLKKEEIQISLSSLDSSSMNIKVRCFTQTPGIGVELKARLNEYVIDNFKKANIEIPYQHLTVNINDNK